MNKEIWRDIKGYEGYYKVSNLGNVMSIARNGTIKQNKILKPNTDKGGYSYVCLHKKGTTKTIKVHRLVASEFVKNPQNKPEVNHIDGNKKNNEASNLEWVTSSENQLHSIYVLKKNIKEVEQYDLNGNYLRTWESVKNAGESLKIWSCDISRVCNGKRKTAGGFIWKYKEVLS